MTRARVRRACLAAVAFTAFALLPGTAGGHPVDCEDTAITAAPAADRFDWLGETFACRNGAQRTESLSTSSGSAAPASQVRAAQRRNGSLKEVGHEPLMNRGMNAAIAIHGDYAYVGSRTDGGHPGQPQGGLMVVDISKPSKPALQNGGPLEPRAGESTRELRVWRSQDVLIVLNTNCGVGPALHHCTQPSISNIRFYDIAGRNAKRPKQISQFNVDTHEFFLWEDPKDPDRALIFAGNAGGGTTCPLRGGAPSCPFSIWDISNVRSGEQPATLYSGQHGYTRFPADTALPVQKPAGGLHSLTISNDGARAYFALLTGGFAVVDVSDFAEGRPLPQVRPITGNADRPVWTGPGAHSAVKLWGRNAAWVSDEVYGTATGTGHGCPWGWTRMMDISDPSKPAIVGEYREPENDPASCTTWNPPRTSYSAHNPTLTPHIAFSTWHSGGMQAVSLEDPSAPYQLAEWCPEEAARQRPARGSGASRRTPIRAATRRSCSGATRSSRTA